MNFSDASRAALSEKPNVCMVMGLLGNKDEVGLRFLNLILQSITSAFVSLGGGKYPSEQGRLVLDVRYD